MKWYGVGFSSWNSIKEQGIKLFSPREGDSYEVFERRPLHPVLIDYCAQDVSMLLILEDTIRRRIIRPLKNQEMIIIRESAERVRLSQTATWVGYGEQMALSTMCW